MSLWWTSICRAAAASVVVENIQETNPDVKFLALSVSDAAEDVIAMIRAGARGYVTKSIGPDELADAITRVHAGDAVFSPCWPVFVLDYGEDVIREGHQFHRPSRETNEGTIRVRVMNVSISTPTATPKPSCTRS